MASGEDIVARIEQMREEYQEALSNSGGIPQGPLTRILEVSQELEINPKAVMFISQAIGEVPREVIVEKLDEMLAAQEVG